MAEFKKGDKVKRVKDGYIGTVESVPGDPDYDNSAVGKEKGFILKGGAWESDSHRWKLIEKTRMQIAFEGVEEMFERNIARGIVAYEYLASKTQAEIDEEYGTEEGGAPKEKLLSDTLGNIRDQQKMLEFYQATNFKKYYDSKSTDDFGIDDQRHEETGAGTGSGSESVDEGSAGESGEGCAEGDRPEHNADEGNDDRGHTDRSEGAVA